VERALRDTDPDTRRQGRAERSRPMLMRIRRWLDTTATRVLPKGLLGQAIAYALGQWPILITFLDDGRLELDNNIAENAIRPFVIGRKNWLFAGSPRGRGDQCIALQPDRNREGQRLGALGLSQPSLRAPARRQVP
jgi:transposase